MTRYRASCHCGNVAIEFEADIQGALSCNCSICSRSGALLAFLPRDAVQVEAAPDAMTTYTFNKHVIQHKFCKTCGIFPFSDPVAKPGNYRVNLGCVDGIDPLALEIRSIDGASY